MFGSEKFRGKIRENGFIPDKSFTSEILERCPYCNSDKLHKKELRVSEFLHTEPNGSRVWITWTRHRYACKNPDCEHKTFEPPDFNVLKGKYMTQETADAMAIEVLQNPDALMCKVGEKFGQSKYSTSRLIRKRINELEKNMPYQQCEDIYFLPFTYRKKECCAVVGVFYPPNLTYLLDIFDTYTPKMVDRFSDRCNWSSGEIYAMLCKFDVQCSKAISARYPHASAVINKLLVDKIAADSDVQYDYIYFKRREALEYLQDVVSQKELNREEYGEGLKEWYADSISSVDDQLRCMLEESLQPLYRDLYTCKCECWRGTHYGWRVEFEKLFRMINKLHKCNHDFDMLKYRLLHANKTAISAVCDEYYTQCVYNFYMPITRPIGGVVGVEINDLYDEICNNNSPDDI